METGIDALESLPRESMLTYGVLFGQQMRRRDPYALGAQLTDLAIRGCISIQESEHNVSDPTLHVVHTSGDMLIEEEKFLDLLRNDMPDNDTSIGLNALTGSVEFTNGVRVLWERVVMMHHTDHNVHRKNNRPLYNEDPTQLIKWQLFRRTWGWLLAVGSVLAEPGWMGRIAGLAEVQSAHEEPELLAATPAGRALRRKVVTLRGQMLTLADSNKRGDVDVAAYEKALPFALLFDDDLKKKWPAFLSRHYADYPSWLVPAQPAATKAHRQKHIAAMLDVMGTLHFPERKRRARRRS